MPRDLDTIGMMNEQGSRCRKLFAAVVLAALDDAVKEQKESGTGVESIAAWARTRDGKLVLSNAGLELSERTISLLMDFVRRGIRPAAA
ncbi:MAG: DUF6280 family protein [Pseudomonadota bacterium]